MIQSPKTQTWIDETGASVPYSRVTKFERKKEKYAGKLLEGASDINEKLIAFKETMQSLSQEIFDEFMKSKEINKPTKGNYTWFNFDRSVKIEVDINERIEFDQLLIKACQEKLNDFLSDNLSSNQEYFRDLVNDAFSTSHGKLDTRKVMSLLKHKKRIKQKKYHEAMDLLEQSITRPSSKSYYRVSLRDDEGKYHPINLNFASI